RAGVGMKELGVGHDTVHASDLAIPTYSIKGQDIFIGIASMHHHALIPWNIYRDAMAPGGNIVVADWHVNDLWTPEGVYYMLSEMNWDRKEECLEAWRKAYGITENPEGIRARLSDADADMIRFWAGYHDLWRETREPGEGTAIWPMEGHRSPEKYMTEMIQAGFNLDSPEIREMLEQGYEVNGRKIKTNPHQILDGSELLMLTVGQK
ncbi:MAG: hypothetical protein ABIH52_01105, partial [Candidatus Aenigmatarchaeota archaeon]